MADQIEYNRRLIAEFRAARGQSAGPFAGRALLLLTTTGARSGQPHTTPLMYIPLDDRLLVIASNIGAPAHPAWYHNLVAHSDVTVEVGAETFPATAVVPIGPERQRLWDHVVALHPFFADHQAKTPRVIPVIALERTMLPQR